MSEIRKAAIEEVKKRDARRRGIVGNPQFKETRRAEAERKRNRKPQCCLFKGNLPVYFRPCVNCEEVDSEEGRSILHAHERGEDNGSRSQPAAEGEVGAGEKGGQEGQS